MTDSRAPVPSRANPHFDRDLTYGKQGELLVGDFLDWIATGNGRVEVKRKRLLDLIFYVETHCDRGRTGVYAPSGINETTADAWAFVLGDSEITILVPTAHVRTMVDDASSRDSSCVVGNCPTRGKLINLAAMLYRLKQHRGRA